MPAAKIGPERQVTITKEVFDALHLEVGAFLCARVMENSIVLVPRKLIDKDLVRSL